MDLLFSSVGFILIKIFLGLGEVCGVFDQLMLSD